MKKKNPFQKTCATLGMLTRAELIELRDLIDDLLTINQLVSEEELASEEAAEVKPSGFGHIELKLIRGYGPYAYLRKWKGKTLTSTYLGKARS